MEREGATKHKYIYKNKELNEHARTNKKTNERMVEGKKNEYVIKVRRRKEKKQSWGRTDTDTSLA